jgi:hypothetical protein
MPDVPNASAPGRAAAATNWQSVFTVAATIGARLDADMRALALGGDAQVLRQFVDDVLAAIDKSKKATPVPPPSSAHHPKSRASSSSSSLPVPPAGVTNECLLSLISVIPHLIPILLP